MNSIDPNDVRGMLENEELKIQLKEAVKRRRDGLPGSELWSDRRTIYVEALTDDQVQQLEQFAQRSGCTVNDICTMALRMFLDKLDCPKPGE